MKKHFLLILTLFFTFSCSYIPPISKEDATNRINNLKEIYSDTTKLSLDYVIEKKLNDNVIFQSAFDSKNRIYYERKQENNVFKKYYQLYRIENSEIKFLELIDDGTNKIKKYLNVPENHSKEDQDNYFKSFLSIDVCSKLDEINDFLNVEGLTCRAHRNNDLYLDLNDSGHIFALRMDNWKLNEVSIDNSSTFYRYEIFSISINIDEFKEAQ